MSHGELKRGLPEFPDREVGAHKGTFGKALIVAGSWGMTGAAILAGKSALRSGVGLVSVATPERCLPLVASGEPSYMTVGLGCRETDCVGEEEDALRTVMAVASGCTGVAVGPGCGQSEGVKRLVVGMCREVKAPLVIDADGLNCLVEYQEVLRERTDGTVLTPHPGEFSRLVGVSTAEVQAERMKFARAYAGETGVVLVLKGHETIVTDGEREWVNTTGNPGMATGGSGDVLTGFLTGLLAQTLFDLFQTACLAVHLHGMAGDLAAEEMSQAGMIASDLPYYLGKALLRYGKYQRGDRKFGF